MGEDLSAFIGATSKPGEKRSVGRPQRRWRYNVSSDVHGLGVADEWVEVVADRLRWRGRLTAVMDSRA